MNLGSFFNSLHDSARADVNQAAKLLMSSAAAVGQVADTVVGDVVVVGKGVVNVGSFGVRAIVGVVPTALSLAGEISESAIRGPYLLLKKELSHLLTPKEAALASCPIDERKREEEAKRERLKERRQLIDKGHAPGASAKSRAAADRLMRNNQAVELARLSDDAYSQYQEPPQDCPPPGWKKLTGADLKGISPDLLKDSKAEIYQTPPDWPGGQQTVLAFRGTDDDKDVADDYDQAMALPTAQYRAAALLGAKVSQKFGSGVLVTGHSLGGGKAQAAGTAGGLNGMMFNSAGVNPVTLGVKMPAPDQFLQYRTQGDPLTGLQNSPTAQVIASALLVAAAPLGMGVQIGDDTLKAAGAQGLSNEQSDWVDRVVNFVPHAVPNLWAHGEVAPPAIGRIEEVPAIDNDGDRVLDLDFAGQHSIKNLVNGIEEQKTEDIANLRKA